MSPVDNDGPQPTWCSKESTVCSGEESVPRAGERGVEGPQQSGPVRASKPLDGRCCAIDLRSLRRLGMTSTSRVLSSTPIA
jgi:hypothetical protein